MTRTIGRGYKAAVIRSVFLRLAVLVALMLAAPGQALAQTTPRAAEHDGFGRMVFDWDGPIRWSADVVGEALVLRFEKPVAGDPKALLKPLSKYVKSVTVSADRRMLTFPLAIPVQVKSFVTGTSTVVDLSAATKAAAAPKPAGPAPAAPAQAPPAPEPPVDLNVRGGEHTGFNRLVFDWARPVGYTVDLSGGQVTIAFERPARVNATALEASLPADVKLAAVRQQGKGTAVVLTLPADMRVRHFTSGPRVALDLVRPAGSAPPPRAAGATPVPLAPAPGTAEQPPALAPTAPAPAPTTPAEDLAKIMPQSRPGNGSAAAPAAAQPAQPPMVASLGVPFDQPTAAAAFRRAGWLWLVFDRKVEVDTKLLKRTGGEIVRQVEQVEDVRGGTAIRLLTRPGYNPSVRKEGLLWVFDLTEQPMLPKVPLAVERQFDTDTRGRLFLPVSEPAQKPVSFRDPEVGDVIDVLPVMPIGAGVRSPVGLPGADLLATAQGIALVPRADGARMVVQRSGVEVTMPGGFHMSPELPSPGGEDGDQRLARSATGPLDLSRWMRGGLDKFREEHEKLMARFTRLKPEEKNAQRLEIARHYLANSMAAEALGVVKVMVQADPTVLERPEVRAVRGAANFLMERDAEAIEDLSHPSLATDPQAGLWLAAAKARHGDDPRREALMLRLAPEEIKGLSPRIRMALGRIAVISVAAAGDAKAANRIIEAVNGPGLSPRDTGTIAYMQGLAAEAGRNWETAVAKYREAEQGESRPDRAFAARDRIRLQLERGEITQAEAVPQLERLRFAWRGGDFEYRLLKRLGEVQIDDGQYGAGLRTFRTIVENYPEHPDVGTVQELMNINFERLFLQGAADSLPPVVAIGLYDEFQELTPSGEKGDEMIRKLADRLASVDLLDRAAELLRHQVQFRLKGIDKARVGARLAFLELADRKPAQALDSLDMSEMPDLPTELHDQRRYMRVRALADLGRSAEALALIINDHADPAKKLRAEIYWDMKRWTDAATALENLLDPVEEGVKPRLTPVSTRRVIDLATALTLARDDRGLARLRRTYGQQMAATEFKEAFDLLTSAPERGIIDYRRVADKIKQVEDFQTFMSEWRKRVKDEGLSSIN
ncbi:MAG: tetratricopeptide repeat protein [Pseudomonadota bacterium]